MRIFISCLFFLYLFTGHAQNSDFIVKSTGDTLFCNESLIIQNPGISEITILASKTKTSYKASEIKEFFHNGRHYVVRYFSFGTQASSQNPSFAELVYDGKMALYKVAQSDGHGTKVIVHYIGFKADEKEGLSKIDLSWKKKLVSLGNCGALTEAVEQAKFKTWSDETGLISLVKLYNESCN